VHFVGLFLSSLLKMHGPKNKIIFCYLWNIRKKIFNFLFLSHCKFILITRPWTAYLWPQCDML